MKNNLLSIALAGVLLTACTDNKKQEQDLMNQVIKLHDQVMAKDETAVKNKMLLDSLLKTNPAPAVKNSVIQVVNSLNTADEAMENWMHQFNADNSNKPHDEVMKYLTEQKKKLMDVDIQITQAVAQSTPYTSTLKK